MFNGSACALVVADLGLVDNDFGHFTVMPVSAWADMSLAESARQLGKMVEHPNQSQVNPTQICGHQSHPVALDETKYVLGAGSVCGM